MIAIDLCCKAGGASMGLSRAGFAVIGYDRDKQPRYPFEFRHKDIRELEPSDLWEADFVWASPPYQGFTAYKRRPDHVYDKQNLIPFTRDLLQRSGVPYVIENVVGAPLQHAIMLCGSMFGLEVQRHRIFEGSFAMLAPQCNHDVWTPQYAHAGNRTNPRKTVEIGAWRIPVALQKQAIGIDWMNKPELSEAIPPAYSEWIARQFLSRP